MKAAMLWRRELNPATPPWLTIRFWLTLTALGCSVAALVMAAS